MHPFDALSADEKIGSYGRYVDGILDEEDDPWRDAFQALWQRSIIEARRHELSDAQRVQLRIFDDRLQVRWRKVAEMLETLVWVEPDRRHWWWHLDEGPQVRAEAEQAAKEAR